MTGPFPFESDNVRIDADDQVVTLWLDAAGSAENTVTPELLADLEAGLDALTVPFDVLLIRSAKPASFLAGLDPNWAAQLDANSAITFSARGQELCRRLRSVCEHAVSVALIDGPCLGAGLELALACDYRLAVTRPTTTLGFPDAAAEWVPCWGATARLPELLGTERSLAMLLDGSALTAEQALRRKLVDAVLTPKRLKADLRTFLDRAQDRPRKPSLRSRRGLLGRLTDNPLSRRSAVAQALARLADVPRQQRPARHLIIDAVETAFEAEALAAERRAAGEAAVSPARRNHLRLRECAASPTKIFPEPVNPVPVIPRKVGIVGDGDLGVRLAEWFAATGREVVLQEIGGNSATTDGPIRHTVTWQGFDECGWVIEAVEEDLGVKRGVFHELEQRVMPRVPLVSAGTTVGVEAIQAELGRPGRVAGLHFLAPVDGNPIVELVRAPATESDTLAALDAWLRALGKTPVLVSDRPGRVVTRLLLAYLSEAVFLVSEGLPAEEIDRAMRRFGMAFGPLETIDAVGFGTLASLVADMQLARGDGFTVNLLLEPPRELGFDGRSGGEGFYRYRRGRARPNALVRKLLWRSAEEPGVIGHYVFDPDDSLRDAEQRLVMRTVNEAATLLGEEQSATPATIDLAMAHGAGWAPHRGGPLRHADAIGLGTVIDVLTRLAERFGPRFEPCLELQRRAEAGETFYGSAASVPEAPLAKVA